MTRTRKRIQINGQRHEVYAVNAHRVLISVGSTKVWVENPKVVLPTINRYAAVMAFPSCEVKSL
jgi:hypothetical protein